MHTEYMMHEKQNEEENEKKQIHTEAEKGQKLKFPGKIIPSIYCFLEF